MNQLLLKNIRLCILLSVVVLLLLIPLVAMQFSPDVNWSGFDFAVMAILLFGTAMVCEFILRKVKTFKNRVLVCGIALFIFFVLWAEIAVGIFGSPIAGS
ncbi:MULTISPECIES: hypothetical protein [unclassified Leeuwenhoekiella]|uniref:hypothetical protein n=1 Tax=unclassified Leeuwenhoekiella TaxID=2615029 RepID=UPI000C68B747|nr:MULTISPECIES: hypothetical protein [unclassified Leeuwenhoekiella]MAW95217.1 hypothetical protein [Leeuwenhoekiella sp.]MBA81860.1 hypothetical protein [Leeuwenhoekiella sp.]